MTRRIERIARRVAEAGRPVIVLDDDPTGTQAVHGIPVLADIALLGSELGRSVGCFVLTNSRALGRRAAVELARAIGEAILATVPDPVVVSRSDSTLRGHFPGEVDALGVPHDLVLLVPAFPDGGRVTIDSIHYATVGDRLVPVAETEFAEDPVFGYTTSYLPDWVEEKTAGRVRAADVVRLVIDDIERGRAGAVMAAAPEGSVVVADAVEDEHVEAVVEGVLDFESSGRRVLARSAATFARARMGIDRGALLDPGGLVDPYRRGGLVVVGSHVRRTTQQLEQLLALEGTTSIPVDVEDVLGGAFDPAPTAADVDTCLRGGEVAVVATSRHLFGGGLDVAGRVSAALCDVVARVSEQPAFLVTKGGITSSDIATIALGLRRGEVLGQVQPGVPVWRHGAEGRWPGVAQVVYPGNVGGPGDLAALVRGLMR